jgi:hypothetical protein
MVEKLLNGVFWLEIAIGADFWRKVPPGMFLLKLLTCFVQAVLIMIELT